MKIKQTPPPRAPLMKCKFYFELVTVKHVTGSHSTPCEAFANAENSNAVSWINKSVRDVILSWNYKKNVQKNHSVSL